MNHIYKAKKYTKSSVSSSFFGMLLLVAGLGAGIVLVTQPQLLEQKAQTTKYAAECPSKFCNGVVEKSNKCVSTWKRCYYLSTHYYCAPSKCNYIGNVVTTGCAGDWHCVFEFKK